ncbi:MAG: VOC family protein [Phycisphaerae bacterium]
MLSVGNIHLYVRDFERAMRFWRDACHLRVADQSETQGTAYAQLDFPDGGASIQLVTVDEEEAPNPYEGPQLNAAFDLLTSEFDDLLVRLLGFGGQQLGEIETYENLRIVTLGDPDGNVFDLIEVPPTESS